MTSAVHVYHVLYAIAVLLDDEDATAVYVAPTSADLVLGAPLTVTGRRDQP
jgi:hypothetical protein